MIPAHIVGERGDKVLRQTLWESSISSYERDEWMINVDKWTKYQTLRREEIIAQERHSQPSIVKT